jgi:predicted aldo/keto reductase-like oxidoreductase
MSISRRTFLETAALAGLAANTSAATRTGGVGGMPTRILGRTGARVSLLGFGCGSRFLSYQDEQKAAEVLNHALDLGINYVDTAHPYGDGVSEQWVGTVMKSRRKGVWLVTKIDERKADDALRRVEGSLKRLETDHLDLIHVHDLHSEEDLRAIEAKDGVLKALHRLRDEKVTRFIGVTCHHDPHCLKSALEHNDFDCTQMALNAARVGPTKKFADPFEECFETIALPVALRKKMGVTAMKIFGQDVLVGAAPAEQLVRYVMSLPVATAVIGMPKPEHLEENVRLAKSFTPMAPEEMRSLSTRLAASHKRALDRFFENHIDC